MSNKKIAGGIIASAAAITIAMVLMYNMTELDKASTPAEEQTPWNTAGQFAINKHAYKLGEDVFFAGRLLPDQQVLVRVANPEGGIILERYFSGADRELVKFYFKPDTSSNKGIYSKDQLIGRWMMWFEGINNDEIYFEIIDEFVPGAEKDVVELKRPAESTQTAQNQQSETTTAEMPPP